MNGIYRLPILTEYDLTPSVLVTDGFSATGFSKHHPLVPVTGGRLRNDDVGFDPKGLDDAHSGPKDGSEWSAKNVINEVAIPGGRRATTRLSQYMRGGSLLGYRRHHGRFAMRGGHPREPGAPWRSDARIAAGLRSRRSACRLHHDPIGENAIPMAQSLAGEFRHDSSSRQRANA